MIFEPCGVVIIDGNWSSLPVFVFNKILTLPHVCMQERVGALRGGVEFLEICRFEKMEGGEFLFLPRDKVDMAVLNSAGSELDSAIKNPFFGVL